MEQTLLLGMIIGLFLAAIVITVVDFAINKEKVGKGLRPVIFILVAAIIGLFFMNHYLYN